MYHTLGKKNYINKSVGKDILHHMLYITAFPQYENNPDHLADEKLDLSKYGQTWIAMLRTWVVKP